MLYILYKIGEVIALKLPINISYGIAEFIASLKYFLSIRDKNFVKYNLKIVLGNNPKNLDRLSKEVFKNFGKYLVEFFRFPKIDNDFLKSKIRFKNLELIDEALKKGKGLIVVSAHIGNWELGGAVLGMLGYKVNVITLSHSDSRINDFFVKRRVFKNVNGIPLGFALKKCFKVLRDNEILAVLGDRDFSKNGIKIEFFNKATLVPKGPAVLRLKTGAPIIAAFLLRDPDDGFTFYFQKPEDTKIDGFNEEVIRNLTRANLKLIESFIKKYPDQWYVFRKMWH